LGMLLRVDLFNEKKFKSYLNKGLKVIYFGIETLNNTSLNAINKKINKSQILNLTAKIKKYKVKKVAFMMFGLPYQTKNDVKRDIKYLKLNGWNIILSGLTLTNSKLYNEKEKYKLTIDENKNVIETENMSEKDIDELYEMAEKINNKTKNTINKVIEDLS